jgi:hypothetical protein
MHWCPTPAHRCRAGFRPPTIPLASCATCSVARCAPQQTSRPPRGIHSDSEFTALRACRATGLRPKPAPGRNRRRLGLPSAPAIGRRRRPAPPQIRSPRIGVAGVASRSATDLPAGDQTRRTILCSRRCRAAANASQMAVADSRSPRAVRFNQTFAFRPKIVLKSAPGSRLLGVIHGTYNVTTYLCRRRRSLRGLGSVTGDTL